MIDFGGSIFSISERNSSIYNGFEIFVREVNGNKALLLS